MAQAIEAGRRLGQNVVEAREKRGLGLEDKWVLKEWTLSERFGANQVWLRHQAGLTQQELSDRIGVNRVVLGELEQGGKPAGHRAH